MIYTVLKRLIDLGRIDGLEAKLDVFYAAGKLTDQEYAELTGLLPSIVTNGEE